MEWIKKILGFEYLMNTNTGEVHYVPKMGKRCGFIDNPNRKLISKGRFRSIRGTWVQGNQVNGCRWCLQKHDLG
jgi:hypothetical protein